MSKTNKKNKMENIKLIVDSLMVLAFSAVFTYWLATIILSLL